MLRTFASHLRHQWMGAVALFLVLGGGTAYAVTQIDRNSVKSKHIVNEQVKPADINAPVRFTDVGLPDAMGVCGGEAAGEWADWSPDVNQPASYGRDEFGVVHLRGTISLCGTAGSTAFTLPPGFRPEGTEYFHGPHPHSEDQTPVEVSSNGEVRVPGPTLVGTIFSIDGITFRCGPSGQNGCP